MEIPIQVPSRAKVENGCLQQFAEKHPSAILPPRGALGDRKRRFWQYFFDESTRQLDQSGGNRRSKALLSVAHFNVQFVPSLD